MNLEIPAGLYIVAVSGGVDSVALLHALKEYEGVDLIVAHFDHGIRPDSGEDRKFVQELAKRYGLPFVFDAAQLGPDASEAAARKVRYAFLRQAQAASQAAAIITAHHQDDVLETVIINLLRGTGRKGLSSLTSGEGIIRPLLKVPKTELLEYARRNNLAWREDSTNADTTYLRNHIRHDLLPQWNPADKQQLLLIVAQMREVNGEIDNLIADSLGAELNREWFGLLPHEVAREVMATWLRQQDVRDFDRRGLDRLTNGVVQLEPGKVLDISKGYRLLIGKDTAWLSTPRH